MNMNAKDIRDGMSIVILTWRNYDFVNFCIEKLRQYSEYDHELLVHINEYKPGDDLSKLQELGCHITTSDRNLGVSKAANIARKLATKKIIMYFNDDFVALPDWDIELAKFLDNNKIPRNSWLSGTMIEPIGNRPEIIGPARYGRHPNEFQELAILNDMDMLKKQLPNMQGTTWPPNLMYTDIWDEIGGFSEEYFPGWCTDPDLAFKMYKNGTRHFIAVGSCLVYHFCMITSAQFCKTDIVNEAKQIFKRKWGMSEDEFVFNVLKRGTPWKIT